MSERNIHEMLKENRPDSGHPSSLPLSTTTPTGSNPQSPTSPSHNGDCARSPISRIDSIKSWSISTYKCSKQLMMEKLGKSSRTIDVELELHIETLRDTQRKYLNILKLSRALASHFHHMVQTQVSKTKIQELDQEKFMRVIYDRLLETPLYILDIT